MKNKLFLFGVIAILIYLFLFVTSSRASDTLETIQTDTTENTDTIVATYNNVDIVEETEWGAREKTENVDVVVKTKDSGPFVIIVTKGKHSTCEIRLIKGVIVKIFSHDTNKLLDVYGTR